MKRNEGGMTIVEIMVAVVILVVVAAALIRLYGDNFSWIVGAGFRTEALDEAKSSIDQLISAGASEGAADALVFNFNGTSSVTVQGEMVQSTGADGHNDSVVVTLDTFLPK